MHWFWDPAGKWYVFVSGIGGDISIIAAGIAFWWHHTCHVGPCLRPAKHQIEGTPYKVCSKHHPAVPDKITASHVEEAHAEANK